MSVDDPIKDEGMIRGDLPPFEELFKLHHGKVYAVCLRMTGNTAEAEDLTQEVFVQLFRKLGTFRGESAFTTWLHRLTVNQVLMHFRKNRSRKEQLTEDGELPEQAVKAETFSRASRYLIGSHWTKRLLNWLRDIAPCLSFMMLRDYNTSKYQTSWGAQLGHPSRNYTRLG